MGEQISESGWTGGLGNSGEPEEAVDAAGTPEPPEGDAATQRRVRPGPLAALFALVVWPNWTAASLLLATFWMPHFTGCDSRTIRPIQVWSEIDNAPELLGATAVSWPYLWAGLFAVTIFTVALLRPRRPEFALFVAAASVYALIVLAFVISAAFGLFHSIVNGSPPSDTVWMWFLAPVVICPGVWAMMAVRRRDLFSAWARLSTGLLCLAVPTIVLAGVFTRNSRYGFNLAMLACAVLLPSCWGLRWRGRQALVDRMEPPEKIRFRLVHLVIWMTFIAAVCGYYRYLSLFSE